MRFNKILEYFPTPKFLDIPFSGISISDSAVRCIKFSKKDGGYRIEKYKEINISPSVITSGQINNKEKIIQVLSALKKELNLDYVKVSLPEEKGYLFTAKIPIVKPEEVVSAIESKIEENVPVSPGELTFDYKLIDHRLKGHLDVVVSTIPVSVIDLYIEIINSSGLFPLSLEIESQAIARALLKVDSKGTVLVINFGSGKIGLYVVTDRIVRFTSTIPAKNETADNLEFLSQEIKKLYLYWHTLKENAEKPEKKINQIIITGEIIGEPITPHLSSHIDTPVIMGDVWINVFNVNKTLPEISFSDSLRYGAAVGLALPGDLSI